MSNVKCERRSSPKKYVYMPTLNVYDVEVVLAMEAVVKEVKERCVKVTSFECYYSWFNV